MPLHARYSALVQWHQFDAVAEGVGNVASFHTFTSDILLYFYVRLRERIGETRQIAGEQRGVGFSGGAEIGLYAEMHDATTALESDAAATGQLGWFFDFDESKHAAVKRSRCFFAALRGR